MGNHVAKLVRKELPRGLGVDIKEVSAGGIELVEEMMGYDRAIIVDAIATNGQIGRVHRLKPDQLKKTVHFTAPHRFNFASAYQLGRRFGSRTMPKTVEIYGVEIEPTIEFTEGLSHRVSKAARLMAAEIIENLVQTNSQ